jgi:hypothetical protein
MPSSDRETGFVAGKFSNRTISLADEAHDAGHVQTPEMIKIDAPRLQSGNISAGTIVLRTGGANPFLP